MSETDIIQKIEKTIPTMTKVQRRLASKVLEEPTIVAFSSVEQIAKKASVSTASVVRFADAVGCDGYSGLQEEIREYCRERLIPMRRLDKNYEDNHNRVCTLSDIYEQQIQNFSRLNLADTQDKINQTVKLIQNAKHIYTLGARGSFSASYYLGHHLNRVLENCDIVKSDDGLPAYLNRMTKDDLLILFNMPRYDRRLVMTATVAKEKGVSLVAFSDSVFAPYASIADVFFAVPNQSADFHNSLVATLLIVETLITSVIANEYARSRRNLTEMEQILKQLDIFIE